MYMAYWGTKGLQTTIRLFEEQNFQFLSFATSLRRSDQGSVICFSATNVIFCQLAFIYMYNMKGYKQFICEIKKIQGFWETKVANFRILVRYADEVPWNKYVTYGNVWYILGTSTYFSSILMVPFVIFNVDTHGYYVFCAYFIVITINYI